MGVPQVDIAGNRYGSLIAIRWIRNVRAVRKKTLRQIYHNYWEFQCDCGKIKVIRKNRVVPFCDTSIKSCGCLRNINKRKGYEEISGTQWYHIKKSAKVRKLSFNISIKDIWDLFEKQGRKCALSGEYIKFSYKVPWYEGTTASLDRVDSSKGYEIDNVQWVHKDVNTMKWDFSTERFLELIKKIYSNHH